MRWSIAYRLNIFYLLLEKLSGFAEGRYTITVSAAEIATDYEERRTDAWSRIEDLNITKRMISTCKQHPNTAFSLQSLITVITMTSQQNSCNPSVPQVTRNPLLGEQHQQPRTLREVQGAWHPHQVEPLQVVLHPPPSRRKLHPRHLLHPLPHPTPHRPPETVSHLVV